MVVVVVVAVVPIVAAGVVAIADGVAALMFYYFSSWMRWLLVVVAATVIVAVIVVVVVMVEVIFVVVVVPCSMYVRSYWLPGRPRNNSPKSKCFSDFEDVPTIYFSSRRTKRLNLKISCSYIVSICQCYHLVSRTAGEKFFAKDEIAVFFLFHF